MLRDRSLGVVVSCETCGTRIPDSLASVASKMANGIPPDVHAGYLSRRLADGIGARYIVNEYAHWVIDVTRSLHHPNLFTVEGRRLADSQKRNLVDAIYLPYRERVRQTIQQSLNHGGPVIHLSVRTMAARCRTKWVRTDMGLLYDPGIQRELDFCIDWIDELYERLPMLRVRKNHPRRGTMDSLPRAMRQEFAGQPYVGIEVLMNRAWAGRSLRVREEVIDELASSLPSLAQPLIERAA